MKLMNWLAYILMVIGALNWGLVGLFDFNLVSAIFSTISWLEQLAYILIGLAAVWAIFTFHPQVQPKAMQPTV